MSGTFFDLVKLALPGDVEPEELLSMLPSRWWVQRNYTASAYALRYSPRINWQAYVERNPDVQQAGIDPCLHFLRNGIYENRKLVSWHPLRKKPRPDSPLVSVIIINYNNSPYLANCIQSVRNQTLINIEIIVIDDCSTDNSWSIIKDFAANDSRIKGVRHKTNLSAFMSRKNGVRVSTGQYVMFLDSDDSYAQNACETAYNTILLGYDMVSFGAQLIEHGYIDPDRFEQTQGKYDNNILGELNSQELIKAMFIDKSVYWQLAVKIFQRDIIANVMEMIPDAYLNYAEDAYVNIVAATLLRNMYKINDRLYLYRYGSGVSTTNDYNLVKSYVWTLGDTIHAIEEFVSTNDIQVNFANFKKEHCSHALYKWITVISDGDAAKYYKKFIEQFGFKYIMNTLIDNFSDKKDLVAKKYYAFSSEIIQSDKNIRNIGLFFYNIGKGGAEKVLTQHCNLLIGYGYNVTIFTENIAPEVQTPPEANIIVLPPTAKDSEIGKIHVFALYESLKDNHIDMFISSGYNSPLIIWEIMACHNLGIPYILYGHGDFGLLFWNMAYDYGYILQDAYRCTNVLICLSTISELYYRIQGINAIYIPNYITVNTNRKNNTQRNKDVAFAGRLGDLLKNVKECIEVFGELVKKGYDVKLYLIGDCDNVYDLNELKKTIAENELTGHVIITGWTDDVASYLERCSVYLSTSMTESFGLAIGEALAAGLPCVVYDLPIPLAENNPAVIRVPQGDAKGAAREIERIMENPELWQRLSQSARKSVAAYSQERYAENMLFLLRNFAKCSPISYYSRKDYNDVLRYGAFYSGHTNPFLQ